MSWINDYQWMLVTASKGFIWGETQRPLHCLSCHALQNQVGYELGNDNLIFCQSCYKPTIVPVAPYDLIFKQQYRKVPDFNDIFDDVRKIFWDFWGDNF